MPWTTVPGESLTIKPTTPPAIRATIVSWMLFILRTLR